MITPSINDKEMANDPALKAPVKDEESEEQASPVPTPADEGTETKSTPDSSSSRTELGNGATPEIPLSSAASGDDAERPTSPVSSSLLSAVQFALRTAASSPPPSTASQSSTSLPSSSIFTTAAPSTSIDPPPPRATTYNTVMSVKARLSEHATALVPVKGSSKKDPVKSETRPLKARPKTIVFPTKQKQRVPRAPTPKNGNGGQTAGSSSSTPLRNAASPRPEAPAPSPAAASHSPPRVSRVQSHRETSMAVDVPAPSSTTLATPSNSSFVSLPSSSTRTSTPRSVTAGSPAISAADTGADDVSRVSKKISSTAKSYPSANLPVPVPAKPPPTVANPKTSQFRVLSSHVQLPVASAVVTGVLDVSNTLNSASSSIGSPTPLTASTPSQLNALNVSTTSSPVATLSSPLPPETSSPPTTSSLQYRPVPDKTPAKQDKGKGREVHKRTEAQSSEDFDMGAAETSSKSALCQLAELAVSLGEVHVGVDHATKEQETSLVSNECTSDVICGRAPASTEQGEEDDSGEEKMVEVDTSAAVPVIQVIPPQDEAMGDDTAQEQLHAPAALKTPEVSSSGISIRGAAKKMSQTAKASMEGGKVAEPRVVQPSVSAPAMALPQLNVQVPPPPEAANTSNSGSAPAATASTSKIISSPATPSTSNTVSLTATVSSSTSAPSASTSTSQSASPPTTFATSSSAFGLRQSGGSTIRASQAPDPTNASTSTGIPQVQGNRQSVSSAQKASSSLPPPPRSAVPDTEHTATSSPFGIRGFASIATPSSSTSSSLPDNDSMEIDEVAADPAPPAVPVLPSLLSRISISSSQTPSLASAPPSGASPITGQKANSLLGSAPPLGSNTAFSFNSPPEQQDMDMFSLASAPPLRSTFVLSTATNSAAQSMTHGGCGSLATNAGSTNCGSWAGSSATNTGASDWGSWASSSTKAGTNKWGNWGMKNTGSTSAGNWANLSTNTDTTNWGNWGGQRAVLDTASQPTAAQPCACQSHRNTSPIDPANSFWASASASTEGHHTAPSVAQQPQHTEQDVSSGSESGYDSDGSSESSASDWWETVSDSENHVYRSIRRDGVLSTLKGRAAYMRGQRPASSRRPASAPATSSPRVAASTILLGSKRDRDEPDGSDSSGDEDGEMKRQRRYTAPGDASARDQFKRSLRASTRRRGSGASLRSTSSLPSLRSFPIASPSKTRTKSLGKRGT